MSTKIDLDELERKARAATSGGPGGDTWRWRAEDTSPSDVDVLEQAGDEAQVALAVAEIVGDPALICSIVDRDHIAANSPPVTLALLARIRELDDALSDALAIAKPGNERDRLVVVLAKGAVLP